MAFNFVLLLLLFVLNGKLSIHSKDINLHLLQSSNIFDKHNNERKIILSFRSWWFSYCWRQRRCPPLAALHGLVASPRSPELWGIPGERGLCPHSSTLSNTYVRIHFFFYFYFFHVLLHISMKINLQGLFSLPDVNNPSQKTLHFFEQTDAKL